MDISKADLDWIEAFYADKESGWEDYKRPTDYIERALRILYGKRQPYRCVQNEGRTKRMHSDNF